GNAILRTASPAPNFSAPSSATTISGLSLSQPLGIARRSDGVVFVSNQGGTPNVSFFSINPQNKATGVSSCEVFSGNNTGLPAHIQMSLEDRLFAALLNGNKGIVQSLNARLVPGRKSICGSKLPQSFGLSPPAVGIALPPTSVTLNIPGNAAASGNFLL